MAAVASLSVSNSSRNVENTSVIETSGCLYNDQLISDIHALNNKVKSLSVTISLLSEELKTAYAGSETNKRLNDHSVLKTSSNSCSHCGLLNSKLQEVNSEINFLKFTLDSSAK